MAKILNIQTTVFVNRKIEVTANNISLLMEGLKNVSGIEFLPSIINSQSINMLTGGIETIQNLSFTANGTKHQLVCNVNRIDYTINYEQGINTLVEEDINTSVVVLQYLMEKGLLSGNRLAFNVNFLSDTIGTSRSFWDNNLKLIAYYDNREIKEWSSRVNGEAKINISGKDERLNVITNFNHIFDNSGQSNYLSCHSDINTLAENSDMRFSNESISDFINGVKEIFITIQNDIDNKVKE